MPPQKSTFLTVDAIILNDNNSDVVLIKRKNEPFKDKWALPGGFVEYGEEVEKAVVREAKEETGLKVKIEKLFGVYSKPGRDPRGHSVSVCFLCKVIGGKLGSGSDAKEAKFFELSSLPELAFDHEKILEDVKEEKKKKEKENYFKF
jgi:8-oxo-dGTP diphosphatase